MRNHEEQQHKTCCNVGAGIAEISPVLSPHSHNLHKSHRGYSDHVDLNDRPRLRVAACRRSPDRHELHHQFHRYDR
uniref:Uncharacterized protein n=1 Tax=Escherichia coli TaxID=562 RepID=A0AAI8H2E0_ECOLX